MIKMDRGTKSFSSARSGRICRTVLAPPFLIYSLFGISILLQIPAGYIVHNVSFTLGMLLNQVVTLLLPVLIVIRIFGLTVSGVLPFKKIAVQQFIVSAVMMCALAVITDYLIYLTEWIFPMAGSLDEVYDKLMNVTGIGSYIQKFALLCLIPSFCEEVFFRGFCQTGLMRHYGRTAGILLAAAIFAIAHLSPWYLHLYFILGIFLGYLFVSSGSLWIPITCHIINNWWTFSSHALGWNLPIEDGPKWLNIPIIAVSLLVLIATMYIWHYLSKYRRTAIET